MIWKKSPRNYWIFELEVTIIIAGMTKSVTKKEKERPKAQKLDSMVSVTVAFSVAQGMRPQRQRAMHRLCLSLYTSFKTLLD